MKIEITLNGLHDGLFIHKRSRALFKSSVKLEINKGITSNKITDVDYFHGKIKCKKSECAVMYSGDHKDYVTIKVASGYKLSKIFVHGWVTT